jgi:nucleotide-binding universal stress UspA family protein
VGEMNPLGFQAYMGAAQEHSVKAFAHVAELAKSDSATSGGVAVPFETLLVEDVVAYKGIVQAAETQEADLIIVGSHGRNGLQKLFLGGTANKVSSHATQPVLVVR